MMCAACAIKNASPDGNRPLGAARHWRIQIKTSSLEWRTNALVCKSIIIFIATARVRAMMGVFPGVCRRTKTVFAICAADGLYNIHREI